MESEAVNIHNRKVCGGCIICSRGSGCFDSLSELVDKNQSELSEIVASLIGQIKRQDEEIKELKLRLDRVEVNKDNECVDLQKLNHNVNTTIDLELLTLSQAPKVKSFFGGGHYSAITKILPKLKELYEHKDWKLISNLGKMQIYSKKPEEASTLQVLGRCEFSYKIEDIANEIWEQDAIIKNDSNVVETEIVQNVGDDCNIYYAKFKTFLASYLSQSDMVVACQKIKNSPESGDRTIVIPMVSIKAFKKKETSDVERVDIQCGGWILKPLTAKKTLVNIFFDIKYPKSEIPDPILSKNCKSIVSMLRTLEIACSKLFKYEHLGSTIFNRTVNGGEIEEDSGSDEVDAAQGQNKIEIEEDKEWVPKMSSNDKNAFIIVPSPSDIPEIPAEDVKEEHKQYILETRRRLPELVSLVNELNWKFIKVKKGTRIFVSKSERGNI